MVFARRHLFHSDTFSEDRTELMIMVIPYVVADFEEGRELTERIKEQLELHERYMQGPASVEG